MTPSAKGPSECPDSLKKSIDESFGSLSAMLEKFIETGAGQFGSGWVWLVKNPDDSLEILSTANAESVLNKNKRPLLICDVWEHAYYVDFRNERKRFLEAFVRHINWQFVEKNYN